MKGWRGPRHPGDFPTLGWQVLSWMTVLPSPADPSGKARLRLTDEQARFVLRLFEVDPILARPVVRRAQLEAVKGWGKSPAAAALTLAAMRGPVVFDGWDADGEPVGRPWGTVEDSPPPWCQIAAGAEDQTDNTYSTLYAMLVVDDHRLARELNIDQGRTRLYLPDIPGAKLEPVTSRYGTREGQRVTWAVLDETHLWTQRTGGVRLARTIRRNTAKMGGITLETTNAPVLGEGSVAEMTSEDRPEPGVLHWANRPTKEPQPDWTDEQLLEQLRIVNGDARWLDPLRTLAEIRDSATDWGDNLRYHFNVRAPGSLRAVDPKAWAAQAAGVEVPDGTRVGLGFDGSVSRDATFLRGCTEGGHRFTVASWVRPDDAPRDWQVPRLEVEEAVAAAFERWDVGRMLYDPPFWRTEGEAWARRFGEDVVVALDTNQPRRFAPAVDRWRTAIGEGTTTHDGDEMATRHVLAARLRAVRLADGPDDARTQYVLVKGDDRNRIDAAVADVLAFEAAMTMPAAPAFTSVYETRGVLAI